MGRRPLALGRLALRLVRWLLGASPSGGLYVCATALGGPGREARLRPGALCEGRRDGGSPGLSLERSPGALSLGGAPCGITPRGFTSRSFTPRGVTSCGFAPRGFASCGISSREQPAPRGLTPFEQPAPFGFTPREQSAPRGLALKQSAHHAHQYSGPVARIGELAEPGLLKPLLLGRQEQRIEPPGREREPELKQAALAPQKLEESRSLPRSPHFWGLSFALSLP